jgi:hypothetical protein
VISRLLTSRFDGLLDEINGELEWLKQILGFLEQPSPLNNVLSNYFADLCENLLGRDKALMKLMSQTGFESLFNHLSNRNLTGLISNIMIKASKSKKLEMIVSQIIKKLAYGINEVQTCYNSSEIICSGISEDLIYNLFKDFFEILFENWENQCQEVKKCKLKVIKAFLEKEKDLKIIDEDSWGSSSTIILILKYSEVLKSSLDTSKNDEILTSSSKSIPRIGETCLIALDICALLADMRQPSINSLINEKKIIENALILFKRHQLSSMFHTCFTNFILTYLNSDLSQETALFLYHFLSQNLGIVENNDICRGFFANCLKTAAILLKQSENNLLIQEVLHSQPGWTTLQTLIMSKMMINSSLIDFF